MACYNDIFWISQIVSHPSQVLMQVVGELGDRVAAAAAGTARAGNSWVQLGGQLLVWAQFAVRERRRR